LKEKHNYKNFMEIPKVVTKICLNQGIGAGVADKKLVDTAVERNDANRRSKSSTNHTPKKTISNFKLREDMAIGCKVTLTRVIKCMNS
jgi:large subunit ribosomal protein L5